MTRSRTAALLFCSCLGTLLAGCRDDPIPTGHKTPLKLSLRKGDRKRMRLELNVRSRTPDRHRVNERMTLDTVFVVNDVGSSGVHEFSFHLDRIRWQRSGRGRRTALWFDFDSHSNVRTPVGQVLRGLLLRPVIVKADAAGEFVDSKEFSELLANLPAPDPALRIGEHVESLQVTLDQMFPLLPEKSVDIRDSWSKDIVFNAGDGITFVASSKATLYDRRNGVAVVKFDGQVSRQPGLSGFVSGTAHVEEKTGWTSSANIDVNISGKYGGRPVDVSASIRLRGE